MGLNPVETPCTTEDSNTPDDSENNPNVVRRVEEGAGSERKEEKVFTIRDFLHVDQK